MQVRFSKSVVVLEALLVLSGCAKGAKEQATGSREAPGAPAVQPSLVLLPATTSSGAPTLAAPSGPRARSLTGSAYFGCGEPIPSSKLWDETTEAEVREGIRVATACAAEHGRKLLLEFVAPWCADCQELARLGETKVVADTLRMRFERVRVNVGKWDRHEALRRSFEVDALATYVVIEPKTSKQLAKTTLEPITRPGSKLRAEDWARWLQEH